MALLAGCTTPGFIPIEPVTVKSRRQVDPEKVNDVLFYQGGGPKRPYKVIGYADEFWFGPYLDEVDLKRMAKLVKEHDGNAGLVVRGDRPLPGLERDPREVGDFVLRLQIIQ
jgi:hypothetical protein